MYELPLTEEFRAFARQPRDIVEGALLIARVVEPATDCPWVRAELQRLAAGAGAPDGSGLLAYLKQCGFAGDQTYYLPANSSLEHVLKSHRGIPITLATVVMGVAAQLGLAAEGINFPQHFLLRVDGVLADPFRMAAIDRDEQRAWLERNGLSEAQAFRPASPLDMVLRMLNNLRMLALQRKDHAAALDLSGYQLLIAPDPLPLYVERVDLWLAVGVPDMARHELEQAIALTPHAALRSELEQRLAAIAQVPRQLH